MQSGAIGALSLKGIINHRDDGALINLAREPRNGA